MIKIESDIWRLWSDPNEGVQWLAGEIWHRNQWLAVFPDCRDSAAGWSARPGQTADAPLTAANFHMLPYSNRIRDGQFTFQGKCYQLANADQHAIHGAVRALPWQIVFQDRRQLVCEIDSADHPDVNWPWHLKACVDQRVDGAVLCSTLTLTNNDTTPMPAGGGWHPYFVRTILGAEPILTLAVNGVFPDSTGDCLPDGPAVAIPASLDFRTPRQLDATQRIDACLAGLDGQCAIDWREAGLRLSMKASQLCRYLVLYNPDMPHFAVEPVTNANDAFNLAERDTESGVQILKPGESMSITMTLTAELS